MSLIGAPVLLLNDTVYMGLSGCVGSSVLCKTITCVQSSVTQTDSILFVQEFWDWKQSCCGLSQKGRTVRCYLGCRANKQPMPVWVTSPRHCEAGTACGWNAPWEIDHWCWWWYWHSDMILWWAIWKHELLFQSVLFCLFHHYFYSHCSSLPTDTFPLGARWMDRRGLIKNHRLNRQV